MVSMEVPIEAAQLLQGADTFRFTRETYPSLAHMRLYMTHEERYKRHPDVAKGMRAVISKAKGNIGSAVLEGYVIFRPCVRLHDDKMVASFDKRRYFQAKKMDPLAIEKADKLRDMREDMLMTRTDEVAQALRSLDVYCKERFDEYKRELMDNARKAKKASINKAAKEATEWQKTRQDLICNIYPHSAEAARYRGLDLKLDELVKYSKRRLGTSGVLPATGTVADELNSDEENDLLVIDPASVTRETLSPEYNFGIAVALLDGETPETLSASPFDPIGAQLASIARAKEARNDTPGDDMIYVEAEDPDAYLDRDYEVVYMNQGGLYTVVPEHIQISLILEPVLRGSWSQKKLINFFIRSEILYPLASKSCWNLFLAQDLYRRRSRRISDADSTLFSAFHPTADTRDSYYTEGFDTATIIAQHQLVEKGNLIDATLLESRKTRAERLRQEELDSNGGVIADESRYDIETSDALLSKEHQLAKLLAGTHNRPQEFLQTPVLTLDIDELPRTETSTGDPDTTEVITSSGGETNMDEDPEISEDAGDDGYPLWVHVKNSEEVRRGMYKYCGAGFYFCLITKLWISICGGDDDNEDFTMFNIEEDKVDPESLKKSEALMREHSKTQMKKPEPAKVPKKPPPPKPAPAKPAPARTAPTKPPSVKRPLVVDDEEEEEVEMEDVVAFKARSKQRKDRLDKKRAEEERRRRLVAAAEEQEEMAGEVGISISGKRGAKMDMVEEGDPDEDYEEDGFITRDDDVEEEGPDALDMIEAKLKAQKKKQQQVVRPSSKADLAPKKPQKKRPTSLAQAHSQKKATPEKPSAPKKAPPKPTPQDGNSQSKSVKPANPPAKKALDGTRGSSTPTFTVDGLELDPLIRRRRHIWETILAPETFQTDKMSEAEKRRHMMRLFGTCDKKVIERMKRTFRNFASVGQYVPLRTQSASTLAEKDMVDRLKDSARMLYYIGSRNTCLEGMYGVNYVPPDARVKVGEKRSASDKDNDAPKVKKQRLNMFGEPVEDSE